MSKTADRVVAWGLAALTVAVYTVYSIWQWQGYLAYSWDLGIFTQLARSYAEFSAPIVSIKGEGFNLLGDHFHPLLVLLGPVYWVFPSGLTLLVVQAVLLGISVAPVTLLARRVAGRGAGSVIAVGYAFSWGLQGAVESQFHEIVFAVPLLAFGLVAVVDQRWRAAALWVAPVVWVKEDLPVTVALIGVIMIGRGLHLVRKTNGERHSMMSGFRFGVVRQALDTKPGRWGAGLTLWGTVWFVLAVGVILPALHPAGAYDYYDNVASSHGLAETVLAWVTPADKLITVVLLVLLAGIIGVRSGIWWLVIPTLAWRFVGNVEHYWGWQWHYSAVLMPIVVVALLDVVDRWPRSHLVVWVTALATVMSTLVVARDTALVRAVEERMWQDSWHSRSAGAALEEIEQLVDDVAMNDSDEVVIAADFVLLAYLVPHGQVYWIGNETNPAPDVVVVNYSYRNADAAEVATGKWDQEYEPVARFGDFHIARVAE